jgi:hypothetical protein
MAKSDRCAKGTKMTCGPEYEEFAKLCKKKYNQEVDEMYLYENGAVGVFLKNGQFRFVRGSTPEILAGLREKRSSKSMKKSSSKKSASPKKLSVGGAINLLQQFYKNQSQSNNASKKSSKKLLSKLSKKKMSSKMSKSKKSSKKSMRK